ncbi:nuclease [Candidatus Bathyarchaeota archaeon]|nr:nuclease [Candidatus Bathyarchaeota archaeon]
MSSVKIFWDPEGQEVDQKGRRKFVRVTDGDTPYITMSIRMLSIDTPEVHYPSNQKPSKQDANLAQLAEWIDKGEAPISRGLGDYLCPKLATGKAGTLQEEQGKKATEAFRKLLDKKLEGTKRSLFIWAADEHFDEYGRLLAYVAPYYTAKERKTMSRRDRATFNLLMVKSGWGASFPIYPSIPRMVDLVMLQQDAKKAYTDRKGFWADKNTLAGYEFRMCVKLQKRLASGKKTKWISRYCVDMTTREIFFPQDYYKVKPYNRIFIWPKDVPEAVGKMNLLPVGTST